MSARWLVGPGWWREVERASSRCGGGDGGNAGCGAALSTKQLHLSLLRAGGVFLGPVDSAVLLEAVTLLCASVCALAPPSTAGGGKRMLSHLQWVGALESFATNQPRDGRISRMHTSAGFLSAVRVGDQLVARGDGERVCAPPGLHLPCLISRVLQVASHSWTAQIQFSGAPPTLCFPSTPTHFLCLRLQVGHCWHGTDRMRGWE